MSTERPIVPSSASRRPLEPVVLPNWGGQVLYVRRLSAAQGLSLPDHSQAQFIGELVAKSVCYQDGERVWQDHEIETVTDYPIEDLRPLVAAAMRVNGITENSTEDRMGNSESGPTGSSSSRSLENSGE